MKHNVSKKLTISLRHMLMSVAFCLLASLLYSQGNNEWIERTHPPFQVGPRISFSLNNYGYWGDIEGDSTLWRYEVSTDSWTQMQNMPAALPGPGAVYFTIDTCAFIMPVINSVQYLYKYFPDADTWVEAPTFPGTPRYGAQTFNLGYKAYVCNGKSALDGAMLPDVWEYDLIENTWTQKNDVPFEPRVWGASFAINNKGYMGMGLINANYPEPYGKDIFEYDQQTDTWTQKADMPTTRGRYVVSGFSINDNGYILCGELVNPIENTDEFWRYNPASDSWIALSPYADGADNWISTFVIANSCYSGKFGFWEYAVADNEIACNPLPASLQQGLVGYWPFCGNANDESGNGNDGVVNGATLAEDRFGNAGSAYELNGTDNYISASSDSIALLPSEEITLSVWFKIDANGAYSGNNLLGPLMRSRFYGYVVWYDSLSTSIQVITHHDNNGEIIGSDTRTPAGVNDNNWHLLTSTFNGDVSNLYLDGALVDSYNISGNLYYVPDGIVAFGKDGNNPSPLTAHYAGSLDDIGIWNRALTPAEITSLYTGEPVVQPVCAELDPSLQTGLVGYWPFCGNANDESGNENDGTLMQFNGIGFEENSNLIASLGADRFGNSLSALATTTYASNVEIPVSSELFENEFTISLWAKNDSAVSPYPTIVESENFNFIIQFGNTGGPVSIGSYMNGPAVTPFGGVYSPINFQEWSLITVVNENFQNKFYINGVLMDTSSDSTTLQGNAPGNFIRIGNGLQLPQEAFYGLIDDLTIHNRALTPAEITSLYTGEPVVQPACAELDPALQNGLVGYWPFCGNANDESGNGLNGQLVYDNVPTLTPDRFGITNSAYSVSAAGNGVILPAPAVGTFASGEMSYSIWYNEVVSNDFMHIFSAAGKPLLLGPNSSGISAYDGNSFYVGGLSTDLSVAGWKNIVTVYQQDTITIYINGIEAVSQTTGFDSPIPYLDAECIFGLSLGGMYPFLGQIDDAVLWNRALTAEEVALLYGNFTQPVAGCTDPLAFNYNPQANQNEGCLYTASVFVYNDLNGNGEHESNEPGLSNWPVLGNDINGLLWTNGNGNAFVAVPQGAYQFTVLNTTDNWVSTTPTSVTIDLTSGPATASFGLQVIPGEAIVAAGPFTGFWDILHCTEGYESGVYLENIGSQAVSGFMTLTCDPLFTPDADSYFTTPPVEVGPGYALWNVEDFLPGEYELLSFHIDGPGVEYLNQSFTFDFDITLFDPQGNMIYSDNWSVSPIVACAYDPNDITGFPAGLSAPHEEGYTIEHYILPENMVEFRVRFQNTGTLPAEDIDIYIPIDPNQWELNTIFPLMRSAEMQVICLHDDGLNLSMLEHELPEGVTAEDLLIFSFDDIYLPDSASNPDGSQGYVYFRMQAKHTLNIGDDINAQAFIYFEQNPAVVTNETYHVIFDCTSFTPMVGDTELCGGEALQFSASQANVDDYAWNIGSLEGSGNIFLFEGIDAGEYTLELNTSNMLCPQGEDHQVTVIVHDIPQLDVPLNATVCEGESITFDAASDGDVSWSNGANTDDIIEATESFTVTATAVGAGGCSVSEDWSVTVNPLPSVAVDTAGNVLTAQDGTLWQWTVNGMDAATTQSITAEADGNYQVVVTNEFGCTLESDVITMDITNNILTHSWSALNLYPNPMTTTTRLELPQGTFDVALYDITGACVRMMPQQQGVAIIERESLTSGVYQVRIVQAEQSKSLRLVVE